MSKNDPAYQREYMRKRRETAKDQDPHAAGAIVDEAMIPPQRRAQRGRVDPDFMKDTCFEHSFRRTDDGKLECRVSGVIYPKGTPTHTDGLPDWEGLIQGIPARQQAALLERFPHTKSRFDK